MALSANTPGDSVAFARDSAKADAMTGAPQEMSEARRKVFKRLHYPIEVMLVHVSWYAAYPLSLRNFEEMMAECGVVVEHTTVHRGGQDAADPGQDISRPQAPGRPELAY